MTCRGSRRNTNDKAVSIYEDSPEWLAQNQRSTRNFIRKWGHMVMHDALMKPIIPSKYNIEINLFNAKPDLLELLEPWCDNIYVDLPVEKVTAYIQKEQPNTKIPLATRVNYVGDKSADIIIRVDGSEFNNQDFQYIQQLSQILDNSGQIGEFQLGHLSIKIEALTQYTENLINL